MKHNKIMNIIFWRALSVLVTEGTIHKVLRLISRYRAAVVVGGRSLPAGATNIGPGVDGGFEIVAREVSFKLLQKIVFRHKIERFR